MNDNDAFACWWLTSTAMMRILLTVCARWWYSYLYRVVRVMSIISIISHKWSVGTIPSRLRCRTTAQPTARHHREHRMHLYYHHCHRHHHHHHHQQQKQVVVVKYTTFIIRNYQHHHHQLTSSLFQVTVTSHHRYHIPHTISHAVDSARREQSC
jgi:hypothetical protein